jgi:hypothetical protein
MRAILKHPAIIVFLALSLAPAALIGINGPWFGGGAGPILRAPVPFPSNLSPQTFRRISTWFNDRMGMRYPLMVLDSHWRLAVWHLRFRGDVLFGNRSWLFFNDDPPEPAARSADLRGRLRMPEAEIAQIDRQMAAVRAELAACGKAAFVAIAPNKQSIYPEELRDGETYLPSRLDDVLGRLTAQTRAMVIDPRAELRAAKRSHGVPNYYPTDSHWNDLGAFIAYQKVVSVLAQAGLVDRPEIATLDGSSVSAEPSAGGDVATRMLFLPWNFPDQSVVLRPAVDPAVSEVGDGDRRRMSNPQGKGRLLILTDSFGPPLARLLARHFREVEMRPRPTWPALFDGEAIARSKADVAMIEIAERSLPELMQPPRALERACGER